MIVPLFYSKIPLSIFFSILKNMFYLKIESLITYLALQMSKVAEEKFLILTLHTADASNLMGAFAILLAFSPCFW